MALGEASKTRVGLLKVGPDWNARPEALRRLMWETQKRTSIEVAGDASKVVVGEAMFETPLLVWRGENAFAPLGENERALLSRYLRFGGLIWVDAANPKCGFVKSIERELDAILPNAKAEALSPEHVLYKSFFLLDHAYGRHDDDVKVLGVNVNERAALLMTFCDVLGAYERDKIGTWRFECTPGGVCGPFAMAMVGVCPLGGVDERGAFSLLALNPSGPDKGAGAFTSA